MDKKSDGGLISILQEFQWEPRQDGEGREADGGARGEAGGAAGGGPSRPEEPLPHHLPEVHHDPLRAPRAVRHRRHGLQVPLVHVDRGEATANFHDGQCFKDFYLLVPRPPHCSNPEVSTLLLTKRDEIELPVEKIAF